jgi:hypothetical protein
VASNKITSRHIFTETSDHLSALLEQLNQTLQPVVLPRYINPHDGRAESLSMV